MITVPALSPRLSSLWLGLVTPLYARIGRKLIEMILPGRAWLEFEVTPDGSGSTIRQTAIYDPIGLGGLAYWYSLYPVHKLIFSGMLRRIAEAAMGEAKQSVPPNE